MLSSVYVRVLGVVALCGLALSVLILGQSRPHDAAPIVVVETVKGSFSFETFPDEAPLTVAHIVDLVKSGFYNGQRIHRALPGFIVQFGDPQTKDLALQALWGRGVAATSGKPIGVAEITKKRMNRKGAVGMAHQGIPDKADSQIYVTLADRKDLDGRYAVFGQLVDGLDVPALLDVGDTIVKAYVKP
jgi:cyclophilin family peptidyl-prolyl cis-trans isomerase